MFIKFNNITPTSKIVKYASKINEQTRHETNINLQSFISTRDILSSKGIVVNINRLKKNIDFVPAKTIEEAVNFGKNILGVKNYDGFTKSDVDVVNWINNGLVHINNATKGKAKMPSEILYRDKIAQSDDLIGGAMNAYGKLFISKDYIKTIKYIVRGYFEEIENRADFVKKIDEKQNFARWMTAFVKIVNMVPEIAEEVGREAYTATYSLISHEMGHLQHCVNTKSNLVDLKTNLADIFSKSKHIAARVTSNAAKSPTEFVAECFAQMIDGIKLDDDIMRLYKKLGGQLF